MDQCSKTSVKNTSEKLLVVNADDLGLSAGVNRGIFEAHERGVVSSASLMVRYPAAGEAVVIAKTFPRLGIGLHLDFSEWAIVDGEWKTLYEVVDLNDPSAVRGEVTRQVEAFFRLVGRGPAHLDSHQHVHRDSRVLPVVLEEAARLGVPLRHEGRVKYCGDFYGQDELGQTYHEGIAVENLVRVIGELGAGTTEVACHPGYDDGLATMYRIERAMEVAALCNDRVRSAIERAGVRVVNFEEVE
jgi:predicted glycoside hydrolase/deacetylase ChbG (UPF0249 family)